MPCRGEHRIPCWGSRRGARGNVSRCRWNFGEWSCGSLRSVCWATEEGGPASSHRNPGACGAACSSFPAVASGFRGATGLRRAPGCTCCPAPALASGVFRGPVCDGGGWLRWGPRSWGRARQPSGAGGLFCHLASPNGAGASVEDRVSVEDCHCPIGILSGGISCHAARDCPPGVLWRSA